MNGVFNRGAFVYLLLVCMALQACSRSDTTIVVGSKNFTEQIILGELLAQHLEANTALNVKRRFNLGGTFVCHQALLSGTIDTYVEYTGTALTAILRAPPSGDKEQVFHIVQEAYRQRFNLEWLPPLGFTNTFAVMIRAEDAARLHIRTLTQLAKHAPTWQAAFGYEFLERADGYPGLAKAYGLQFADAPRVMDLALTYQALADHKVDVIAGDSTNGLVAALNLAVLEDDRHYFPPYQAAPVVSRILLSKVPDLERVLSGLGGSVSDEDMRRLNYEVDGKRRDVAAVVREFLLDRQL